MQKSSNVWINERHKYLYCLKFILHLLNVLMCQRRSVQNSAWSSCYQEHWRNHASGSKEARSSWLGSAFPPRLCMLLVDPWPCPQKTKGHFLSFIQVNLFSLDGLSLSGYTGNVQVLDFLWATWVVRRSFFYTSNWKCSEEIVGKTPLNYSALGLCSIWRGPKRWETKDCLQKYFNFIKWTQPNHTSSSLCGCVVMIHSLPQADWIFA